MERISQEQQHLGTSRTIACTPIVKRIPCSPPSDGYKNPPNSTPKSSPSSHFPPIQSWSSILMPTLITPSPLPSHILPIHLCLSTPLSHHANHSAPCCPDPLHCQSHLTLSPPQLSLFTPCSRLKQQSTSSLPKPTSTRLYEPSLMDLSQLSTTGRSSTPYSLRAYRTPTRPYRTASRTSNVRLTVASSSRSIPLATRTTTGASPPRSPSEAGTMPMPSGSSSATMAVSTSSLGRTLTSSPTPQTSSLTHLTQMRSLHCSLAGSATYSPAPLPPTTPYARQYLTSTTGMPSLRLSDTAAMMTIADTSPTNSHNSSANSPSSTTPSPLPITKWKWHEFPLSFLTSRDAPTRSHTQDVGLLTSVATA